MAGVVECTGGSGQRRRGRERGRHRRRPGRRRVGRPARGSRPTARRRRTSGNRAVAGVETSPADGRLDDDTTGCLAGGVVHVGGIGHGLATREHGEVPGVVGLRRRDVQHDGGCVGTDPAGDIGGVHGAAGERRGGVACVEHPVGRDGHVAVAAAGDVVAGDVGEQMGRAQRVEADLTGCAQRDDREVRHRLARPGEVDVRHHRRGGDVAGVRAHVARPAGAGGRDVERDGGGLEGQRVEHVPEGAAVGQRRARSDLAGVEQAVGRERHEARLHFLDPAPVRRTHLGLLRARREVAPAERVHGLGCAAERAQADRAVGSHGQDEQVRREPTCRRREHLAESGVARSDRGRRPGGSGDTQREGDEGGLGRDAVVERDHDLGADRRGEHFDGRAEADVVGATGIGRLVSDHIDEEVCVTEHREALAARPGPG